MKTWAEIADNAEKSSERGGQGTKGQRGAQKERVEMPPVLQAPTQGSRALCRVFK